MQELTQKPWRVGRALARCAAITITVAALSPTSLAKSVFSDGEFGFREWQSAWAFMDGAGTYSWGLWTTKGNPGRALLVGLDFVRKGGTGIFNGIFPGSVVHSYEPKTSGSVSEFRIEVDTVKTSSTAVHAINVCLLLEQNHRFAFYETPAFEDFEWNRALFTVQPSELTNYQTSKPLDFSSSGGPILFHIGCSVRRPNNDPPFSFRGFLDNFSVEVSSTDGRPAIRGRSVLQGLRDQSRRFPITVTIISQANRETFTNVYPDSNNEWIVRPSIPGTYKVLVKGDHWLRNAVDGIMTSDTDTETQVMMTLQNGDIDNNNFVGTDDYLRLNADFDSVVPSSQRNPSDLNEDGFVNTDDYLIMSQAFDTGGVDEN
jgi:hypothetical protein